VAHLLNQESGICHGKAELKALFDILEPRKPRSGSSAARSISPMAGS
jgi:hypothetical protein